MGDDSPSRGNPYPKDKRAILGGIGTLLATASIAVGAWAHQKLSDHDARLVRVEVQQTNDGQRQANAESHLQRIDDKLDRILERLK